LDSSDCGARAVCQTFRSTFGLSPRIREIRGPILDLIRGPYIARAGRKGCGVLKYCGAFIAPTGRPGFRSTYSSVSG
jgi:hypothetical protein